jgi:putative tryptophan/tyrosine transport system substrate-binding protein
VSTALSRRQFVAGAAGVGLLAGCGRLPWQAEPTLGVPRIGWLSMEADTQPWENALREGLRALGYQEGENILVESRYGVGTPEQLPALVADLTRLPVAVIVAATGTDAEAVLQATRTTPIVVALSSDPVGAGLVASLARPGGNITGLSIFAPRLSGKRLELLHDTLGRPSRLAILGNPATTAWAMEAPETLAAAAALGMPVQVLEASEPSALERLIEAAMREHVGGLIVLTGTNPYRSRIIELAAQNRLPAMYPQRDFVAAGGLMSYGPSYPAVLRRAAYYVDRILKGTQPADLPIEQPMTFEFVVNLKTARELGITFPDEIMLQVTEIIQ